MLETAYPVLGVGCGTECRAIPGGRTPANVQCTVTDAMRGTDNGRLAARCTKGSCKRSASS
eukprot:3433286-Rhodomonas_salina.1